ncbi:MAG: hypothetical protein H7246_15320, partial [Phycisphaerae bacterium]|nr:hypothetical protein [Saprospiraceae bacterium]
PDYFNWLTSQLLQVDSPKQESDLIFLYGMSGVGKSMLAAAIVHQSQLQQNFTGGIFWFDGRHSLIDQLRRLGQHLGLTLAELHQTNNADLLAGELHRRLEARKCLFVLDNVIHRDFVIGFRKVSSQIPFLVTTQDRTIGASLNAQMRKVELLPTTSGRMLLAQWAGLPEAKLPAEAREVIQHCGGLALALAVCGAKHRDDQTSWHDLMAALKNSRLKFLDHPQGNVWASIDASIAALSPDMQSRYLELSVFFQEQGIPEAAVWKLWQARSNMEPEVARDLITRLERRSLIQCEGIMPQRLIRLHDLQLGYLRQACPQNEHAHLTIIAAYRDKASGILIFTPDDGYFHAHIGRHLKAAGLGMEISNLLLDFHWLQRKLKATDIYTLLADFDLIELQSSHRLLHGALNLSSWILAQDKNQLASEIIGRLPRVGTKGLQKLLREARAFRSVAWLEPLAAAAHPAEGPLLKTLLGNGQPVLAVAISADGRWAVSATEDGTIRVWNVTLGKAGHLLPGHRQRITCLALSSDGQYALSGAEDCTIKLWDVREGHLLKVFKHSEKINATVFSLDGKFMISGSNDRTLKVWEIITGKVVRMFADHVGAVTAIALFSDGKRVLSGTTEGEIRIWNWETGSLIRSLDLGGNISGVSFLQNQAQIVVRFYRSLWLVDWERGELLGDDDHDDEITSFAVTANGKVITANSFYNELDVKTLPIPEVRHPLSEFTKKSDAPLKDLNFEDVPLIYDPSEKPRPHAPRFPLIKSLTGHSTKITCVAVTPDGKRLISGDKDSFLKIWNLDHLGNSDGIKKLDANSLEVTSLAIAPDGMRAITISFHFEVCLWDLKKCKPVSNTFEYDFTCNDRVSLSADGKRAVLRIVNVLSVYDLQAGKQLRSLMAHPKRSRKRPHFKRSTAITPDGKFVVAATSENRLIVWNVNNGRVVGRSVRQRYPISEVAITPNGKKVVFITNDNSLTSWNLKNGRERRTPKITGNRLQCLAIAPDGKTVLTGTAQKLTVWKLENEEAPRRHRTLNCGAHYVSVSSDGRNAFSAANNKLTVWNLETIESIASWFCDHPFEACVCSQENPRLVVVADADLRIHFLKLVHTDDLVAGKKSRLMTK